MARLIAPNYNVLCAAPAYAARAGLPQLPEQLVQHACIVYGARPTAHWHFHANGQPLSVPVRAPFLVNDGSAAQALALEGAGVLYKSIWDVGCHIQAGRLLRVMPDLSAPTEPLHAVFPHGRQLSPRVRHFLDFAIERLRHTFQSIQTQEPRTQLSKPRDRHAKQPPTSRAPLAPEVQRRAAPQRAPRRRAGASNERRRAP
jgi:DNA-binding transcriptional LysR family regulator